MFRTALDIFNKSGVQTPIKARVAERLGRAEMLCQAYAESGDALMTAGEFSRRGLNAMTRGTRGIDKEVVKHRK